MAKRLVARLTSQDMTRETKYLFGSHVTVEDEAIIFSNPRIAPGKALLNWHSMTNFQAAKKSPDLPILVAGKRYQIKMSVKTEPVGRFYTQLTFYNRQEEKIKQLPIRKDEDEFVCPEDTYTYDIKLMTAGCKEARFESLELWTTDDVNNLSTIKAAHHYSEGQLPQELDLVKNLVRISED